MAVPAHLPECRGSIPESVRPEHRCAGKAQGRGFAAHVAQDECEIARLAGAERQECWESDCWQTDSERRPRRTQEVCCSKATQATREVPGAGPGHSVKHQRVDYERNDTGRQRCDSDLCELRTEEPDALSAARRGRRLRQVQERAATTVGA